ncbi:MAG: hypothetical protein IPP90_05975 [Gemmatimonadaceae bacterium]|nr:hypothetical protein [Gemmatimonadaceae bacterium]
MVHAAEQQTWWVISRVPPASLAAYLRPAPAARPTALFDRGGRPWFNLFGTNRISTIDPTPLRVRE